MAIDRDASLKNAEKLLRVGRLDAAIAEYARLVDDQPKDWNTANTLGDLYLRAGQSDKAMPLYRRTAEQLLAEGFYPKAAALFRKTLKLAPADEDLQLRIAEISALQGLLADAKAHYRAVERQRRQRGDTAAADAVLARFASLDPGDLDARLAGARALERTGDLPAAARHYRELYDAFAAEARNHEAIAALRDCARCSPDGVERSLLLPVAEADLRAGDIEQGRARLTGLLDDDPAWTDAVADLGVRLAAVDPEAGAQCIDIAANAYLAAGRFEDAARVLDAVARQVPHRVPLLLRLVEICVDGGLESRMYQAQAVLADAYLAVGQAAEARVIAEDLVARDAGDTANVERLRRALTLLGVPDVEAEIAARLQADPGPPAVSEPPVIDETHEGEQDHAPGQEHAREQDRDRDQDRDREEDDAREDEPEREQEHQPGGPTVAPEIDLTGLLEALGTPMPDEPPVRDLDAVFADLRARRDPADDDESAEHLALARTYIEMGMAEEAVGPLEIAARSPHLRFTAAALLARVHRDAGDLAGTIDWLERAAEAPAPAEDDARELLYDLADVLELAGETARALAILLELDAGSPSFRDVGARITRLSQLETEG